MRVHLRLQRRHIRLHFKADGLVELEQHGAESAIQRLQFLRIGTGKQRYVAGKVVQADALDACGKLTQRAGDPVRQQVDHDQEDGQQQHAHQNDLQIDLSVRRVQKAGGQQADERPSGEGVAQGKDGGTAVQIQRVFRCFARRGQVGEDGVGEGDAARGRHILAFGVEEHITGAVAAFPKGEGIKRVGALLHADKAVVSGTVGRGERADQGKETNAPVIRPEIVVQSADDHALAICEAALQRGERIRVRERSIDIFLRFVERPGADIVALGVEYADAQGAAIRGVDGGQETAGAYGVHQVRMKIVVLRAVVQQGDEEVEQLCVGGDLRGERIKRVKGGGQLLHVPGKHFLLVKALQIAVGRTGKEQQKGDHRDHHHCDQRGVGAK